MDTNFKLAVLISCALLLAAACHGLELGYYKKTCPRAEAIVKAEVRKALSKNAGVGAGLIRLLFHDCFVEVRILSRHAYTRITFALLIC